MTCFGTINPPEAHQNYLIADVQLDSIAVDDDSGTADDHAPAGRCRAAMARNDPAALLTSAAMSAGLPPGTEQCASRWFTLFN